MPRRRRPPSCPSLLRRAHPLLCPPSAVELATAAVRLARGSPPPPSYAVLLLDDSGLSVAVHDLDIGPPGLADACAALLAPAPPRGPAAAVVVFLDPGSGADTATAAEAAWHETRRRLAALSVALLDWLVVAGDDVVSVPARFGEPTPW